MICTNCGQEVRDDALFCAHCGTRMNRCPECGFNNHQEAKFCRNCGCNLQLKRPNETKTKQINQKALAKPGKTAKKNGAGKKVVAVLLIVLLLGALVTAGGYFAYMAIFNDDRLDSAEMVQEENRDADAEDTGGEHAASEAREEQPSHTDERTPEENETGETSEATSEAPGESASELVTEPLAAAPAEAPTEAPTEAPVETSPVTIALQYVDQPGSLEGHAYGIFDIYQLDIDTFMECEAYCESVGGHLAVIESQEENDYIYQYIQDNGHNSAFFGYTDREKEGEWKWVTGDSLYTNWAPGQPNNGAANPGGEPEHYAHFFFEDDRAGMWNDAPFGSNTHYIVCEWE